MTLYTGRGDDGTSELFASNKESRLLKHALIFEVLGTFDELNSVIGWCRTGCIVDWMIRGESVSEVLLAVQQSLFIIQAELAGAKKSITKKSIKNIEERIAIVENALPEISSFFISGGNELSARLDIARVIARRTERRLVALDNSSDFDVSENVLIYTNRLSSLLYALVRFVNHRACVKEQSPKYGK